MLRPTLPLAQLPFVLEGLAAELVKLILSHFEMMSMLHVAQVEEHNYSVSEEMQQVWVERQATVSQICLLLNYATKQTYSFLKTSLHLQISSS